MRKYLFIFICFLLVVPVFVYSQTAQKVEDLLNMPAVSNGQAAWLVLEAADISGSAGISSEEEAFRYAADHKWFPSISQVNGKARLDRVSVLIMQAFKMKGGILFSLTKNPHYAYRELVYRNVIIGRADPQMDVTGYELLYMVNRVLAYQEAGVL